VFNGATITTETTCLGNLSFSSGTSSATVNGAKVLFGGNLSTTVIVAGTSTLEFTGSGAATWGVGAYRNNIVVNKSGGAIVTAAAGTITYGFGSSILNLNTTVDFITNSTLFTFGGGATINNVSDSPFFNMTIATTLTLNNATARILGTLTITGNTTFAGTVGWTCKNLFCSAAGTITITLQELVTYTTTDSVIIIGGTNAARTIMTSSGGSNRAIWTLAPGATQNLIYVNGVRIDSLQNNSQTIWSFGVSPANISTSLNWSLGTRPGTVAYVFVY
jgi:hypothetical protein